MNNQTQPLQKAAPSSGLRTSQWMEVKNSTADIKNSFGFMPDFVDSMTDQSMPGAWSEVKNLFYNRNTAIENKIKDLIGYAIAVQTSNDMLKSINSSIGLADGVSPQEQAEAMLMSAITRHWSTVLNGSQIDKNEFRKETDKIMSNVAKMMDEAKGQLPPEEAFLVNFTSAQETYADIQKTLGLVPQFFQMFPEEGISGAWSEFKAIQLNPHTAIDNKHKELIGLAIAAQIPCDYCIYFHRSAARLFGATDREIREAVGLSALTRHWGVVFQGSQLDLDAFKQVVERMMEGAKTKTQLHS